MKFKDILAWIKAHIGIVISCVVLLVSLPAAFVGSNMWLKKTLSSAESKAKAKLSEVDSMKIDYVVPQVDPSVPSVSVKHEPNARLTEVFAKAREQAISQSKVVVTGFEEFNKGVGNEARKVGRGEHTPLVEGLFPAVVLTPEQQASPAAKEDAERAKLNAMEDALLGKRGRPNPYQQVLATMRGGAPLSLEELGDLLRDTAARYREQTTSNNRQLTDDEARTQSGLLIERRMSALRSRAAQLGVYASLDVFDAPRRAGDEQGGRGTGSSAGGGGGSGSGEGQQRTIRTIVSGTSIEPSELTPAQLFLKQWDLWFLSDMASAVALANGGADAKQGIEQSVVKRVQRMRVFGVEDMKSLDKKPAGDPTSAMELTTEETAPAAPQGGVAGLEPLDPTKSITGLVRGGWNKTYEVRRGEMVVVVSSARLQELLAAIARTNLMNVTGVKMEYIDIWEEARQGFFYGDEHVVRATIQIESLWLKSWLVPLMPVDLQKAMWMEVAEAPPA